MTNSKFMKGLLGATALTVLSTGTAFAQNEFTEADTTVSNSFTLDYDVLGVEQPTIETVDDPADPSDNDDPTTFKVDRLVNVTVATSGNTTVAPGQTDAEISFSVVNNGNDTHAYLLGIEEMTTGTTLDTLDDTFDTDAPTSTNTIIYFVDTDGDGVLDPDEDDVGDEIVYDPANPPVLDPDATLFVVVRQDIPVGASDEDIGHISLYADTQTITGTGPLTFTETLPDAGGVNDPDATENVLADVDGPATTNDGDADGAHSDSGAFLVSAADISAVKTVQVLSEDDSACTLYGAPAYVPPAEDDSLYSIPGACVEYQILVSNDGTEDATELVLSDIMTNDLLFVDAKVNASLTGTLTEPTPSTSGTLCSSGSPCTISLTAGGLVGKATSADPAVTGALYIRALIQ